MSFLKTNNKTQKITAISLAIATLFTSHSVLAVEESEIGKVDLDFRLRYENVNQDNSLENADALTLRTTLTYLSPTYHDFSAVIQFEDSRQVLGVDQYNDAVGHGVGYSVVADPETTELDQGYVKYKYENLIAKVGRQVISLDNQRFVGAVDWRQDKQTFDAGTLEYQVNDKLAVIYSYINKRNRIFAQDKDIYSGDQLIHGAYSTDYGTVAAYAYLLEKTDGPSNSLDTYGLRFTGKTQINDNDFSYTLEYANQESDTGDLSYSADYYFAEGAYSFSGITATLGYESLGSDNDQYAFSTPLATLHKFNGWSDQFLNTPLEGLNDAYVSVAGKAFSGKWAVIYHDFTAEKSTDLVDDLGSEVDAVYTRQITKQFTAGLKYANYSAGDKAAGKVDTDKVWVWVSAKF